MPAFQQSPTGPMRALPARALPPPVFPPGAPLTPQIAHDPKEWRGSALTEKAQAAVTLRQQHWGHQISYSRKVFIPLTRLCGDACGYCTFVRLPHQLPPNDPTHLGGYLRPEAVLEIAHAGKAAGCREALFSLGDRPEQAHPQAKAALHQLGYAHTIDYLLDMAQRVLEETGLLPHINAGVLGQQQWQRLKAVAPSMGLMAESFAPQLNQPGGAHFLAPHKVPQVRYAALAAAGKAKVPLTTGLLIGIGESWSDRVEALCHLAQLHEQYGHLQEVIIQNFVPKPGTPMHQAAPAALEQLQRTLVLARLLLPPEISLQAPPNLNPQGLHQLLQTGLNDWGGISPVTADHINPEKPWPQIEALAQSTAQAGLKLVERLTVYERYTTPKAVADGWLHPHLVEPVRHHAIERTASQTPAEPLS